MAEIGAVAAIIQVADTGLRLSTTLFTFAETVASANRSINTVSKDVSLTSAVLKDLANILSHDNNLQTFSDTAIESAIAVVNECSGLFQELHGMLIEKLPKHSSRHKDKVSRTTLALERLKWPYMQPKMNLLQTNLDRLKSSLLVIINAISLAKIMKIEPSSADIGQKDLVKDLIKSNQEHVRRYQELKHSIPNASTTDRQHTLLIANTPEGLMERTRSAIFSPEQETKLNNLHHFNFLFKTLMAEISSSVYEIGSQSRARIEKHILSARASEIACLYQVHGKAAVRDVWEKLESRMAATLDNVGHVLHAPQALDSDLVSVVSSKKPKDRGQEDSIIRLSDDGDPLEESKSWFIANDSADEGPFSDTEQRWQIPNTRQRKAKPACLKLETKKHGPSKKATPSPPPRLSTVSANRSTKSGCNICQRSDIICVEGESYCSECVPLTWAELEKDFERLSKDKSSRTRHKRLHFVKDSASSRRPTGETTAQTVIGGQNQGEPVTRPEEIKEHAAQSEIRGKNQVKGLEYSGGDSPDSRYFFARVANCYDAIPNESDDSDSLPPVWSDECDESINSGRPMRRWYDDCWKDPIPAAESLAALAQIQAEAGYAVAVDEDDDVAEAKLDELLRLWTPTTIPA